MRLIRSFVARALMMVVDIVLVVIAFVLALASVIAGADSVGCEESEINSWFYQHVPLTMAFVEYTRNLNK